MLVQVELENIIMDSMRGIGFPENYSRLCSNVTSYINKNFEIMGIYSLGFIPGTPPIPDPLCGTYTFKGRIASDMLSDMLTVSKTGNGNVIFSKFINLTIDLVQVENTDILKLITVDTPKINLLNSRGVSFNFESSFDKNAIQIATAIITNIKKSVPKTPFPVKSTSGGLGGTITFNLIN